LYESFYAYLGFPAFHDYVKKEQIGMLTKSLIFLTPEDLGYYCNVASLSCAPRQETANRKLAGFFTDTTLNLDFAHGGGFESVDSG
jgi:hypothetical protein